LSGLGGVAGQTDKQMDDFIYRDWLFQLFVDDREYRSFNSWEELAEDFKFIKKFQT